MGHVRVTGQGKVYKQYPSRWSHLGEWLVPYASRRHYQHWALQDITFNIAPGDAVGITGIEDFVGCSWLSAKTSITRSAELANTERAL
ncbi:hypothetical protein [Pseudomonas koreensis]|uniref:hypothetical protein n=1 Tax=Pseudomonas koreensis TaxID=198620 RepID=UPI003D35B9E2